MAQEIMRILRYLIVLSLPFVVFGQSRLKQSASSELEEHCYLREAYGSYLHINENLAVSGQLFSSEWLRLVDVNGHLDRETRSKITLHAPILSDEEILYTIDKPEGFVELQSQELYDDKLYKSSLSEVESSQPKLARGTYTDFRVFPRHDKTKDLSERKVIILGTIGYPGIYYLPEGMCTTFDEFISFCKPIPASALFSIQRRRETGDAEEIVIINAKEDASNYDVLDGDVYIVDYLPF